VLRHHRAAQQVLDADAPDSVGVDRAVEQVRHGGDRPDVEVEGKRGVDDAPDDRSRCAGHRDEERLGTGREDRTVQRLDAPVHTEAGNRAASQGRIVVEEPDGEHASRGILASRPRQQAPVSPAPYSRVTRRSTSLRRVPRAFEGHADPEADTAEDGDAQDAPPARTTRNPAPDIPASVVVA
jgi:hypothetical protein